MALPKTFIKIGETRESFSSDYAIARDLTSQAEGEPEMRSACAARNNLLRPLEKAL